MILDGTGKSIEILLDAAAATTELPFMVAFSEIDLTAQSATPMASDGITTGSTAATVLAAPSSGKQRRLQELFILNEDTDVAIVTVRLNSSSTYRKWTRVTLEPGWSLQYLLGIGWQTRNEFGAVLTAPGAQAQRSLFEFQHVDGGGGIDCNLPAGAVNGTALSTITVTANRLYAVPFVAPGRRDPLLDRLAVYVTTGVASSNVRFGIYDAVSESNLYPGSLLYDGGTFTSTVSGERRAANPDIVLVPGKLYWATVVSDAAITLRGVASAGVFAMFGISDALSSASMQSQLTAAHTFGALPSTYPSGAASASSVPPAIFLRYGA